MDVFLYLWGGEGYLTCASVHAMAMMGMFDNIGNARLNFKCLDFAGDSADNTRWESMAIAFDRYHRALFGDKNESVVCGDTNEGGHFKSTISKVVSNPASEMTLSAKYNNNELLYIGCSRDDVKLDIKEGIYGKPWVGEAYHADSHFDALYPRSLDGAPITVINCGGYKGGGTAATFIPLEATHSVTGTTNVTRFNVVAGPSTQFNREVPLDHPDAYNTRVERVDRFEIEEKKAELENDVKPDAVSKQNHKANKSKLENAWKEVYSPPKDYRNLNPDFYMGRFIDKIRSDDSINSVDATFVNLKANLKPVGKSCNYDCTAAEYKPDKQEHILHITNLINAITVKELMKNGAAYKNHKIYTFQTPGNVFRTHDMFEPEDAKNLYYFLEFVIFLVKYVYPNFNEFERPGADVFWKKWAIKVGRNYAIGSGNGKSASEYNYNKDFASGVAATIRDFLVSYAFPALDAFMGIQSCSEDVEIFDRVTLGNYTGGLYEVVVKLLTEITNISRGMPQESMVTLESEMVDMLAAVLTIAKKNQPAQFANEKKELGKGLLRPSVTGVFTNEMPAVDARTYNAELHQKVKDDAERYAKELIGFAYNMPRGTDRLAINTK